MYGKFVKAIHEVQQKSNFKNLLLEKKLAALADTLEKKVRVILRNLYEKKTNLLLVTLRNYDGDGKKAIGLMSKTTPLRVYQAFW